jgi:Cu(I)/Ag(I) efflux system membrane fusion protein
MSQGRIAGIAPRGDRVEVRVTLAGQGLEDGPLYVLEIVTEPGEFLSVPNEAILETGGKHVVYVQQPGGRYTPREIEPGIRGELFTQVLNGLTPGEQVVTTGSFFIDAEHKLKGP